MYNKSTQELALDTSQSTICCHLKNIGKVSKLGTWVSHTLYEKNKEDCTSIMTSFSFSRQKNGHFLRKHCRWWKISLLWQCSMQKAMDWQGWILQPTPKVEFNGKKNYAVHMMESLLYYLFWVFKLQSACHRKHTLISCYVWMKILKKNAAYLSIREILCFSMICKATFNKNHKRKNVGYRLVCSTPSRIFTRLCIR